MPIPGGTAGAHDDNMHQGSAKRDVVDGVVGLDGTGEVLGVGNTIQLTRDVSNVLGIVERTSSEFVLYYLRLGALDYRGYLKVGGVDDQLQVDSMKDAVSGIAALDAGGAVLAPGSEVKLTRDGSDNIEVVERTSGDIACRWTRTGLNSFTLHINCGGVACKILTEEEVNIVARMWALIMG